MKLSSNKSVKLLRRYEDRNNSYGRSGCLTPDVIDTLKDVNGQRTEGQRLMRFSAKNFTHPSAQIS